MDNTGERLAELEHKQWAHWTEYMLNNLTADNIVRWRQQINTPYSELSEKEKDSDRKWANKVLDIIIDDLQLLDVPNDGGSDE